MTAAEFAEKLPKPWYYVMHKCTFTLHAANGAIVAQLPLYARHAGIPQVEWNRHIATALATPEIPVIPAP